MKLLWLLMMLALLAFAAYMIWLRYQERESNRVATVKTTNATVARKTPEPEPTLKICVHCRRCYSGGDVCPNCGEEKWI